MVCGYTDVDFGSSPRCTSDQVITLLAYWYIGTPWRHFDKLSEGQKSLLDYTITDSLNALVTPNLRRLAVESYC